MIVVGTDVTVNENYSGGLLNAVGQTGKVLKIEGDNYLLSCMGQKPVPWRENDYWDYSIIAKPGEINEVDYDFTDCDGQHVHIGDTVAYSGHRVGLLIGKVLGFKRGPRGRWDETEVTKVQVLVTESKSDWDGHERRVSREETRKQWLEHGSRMKVITQNPYLHVAISGAIISSEKVDNAIKEATTNRLR